MSFSKETQSKICDAQNGYCAVEGCLNKIHSIHHKLHDTVHHQKKFPLFLDSPMNGVGLCLMCHCDRSHEFRVTEKLAVIYENWLNQLSRNEND